MKQSIKYSISKRKNPLKSDEPEKAYANIQLNAVLTLDDMAGHIHDHNTVFSKGVILGVLTDMCTCLKEALEQGNAVELGDLGRFTPSLRSEGTQAGPDASGNQQTAEQAFTADKIKGVNVNFTNGPGLQISTRNVTFEYVTTRAAQAAAKAAQKAGKTDADWTPAPEDDGEGGDTNP